MLQVLTIADHRTCCSSRSDSTHQLIRILAASFQKFPAGSWAPTAASLDDVNSAPGRGRCFRLGLRLALPVVALLLLIDVALALLGRMQQQLQLALARVSGQDAGGARRCWRR